MLVRPPGRARQVLLVEGAPGYEHSFIKRAWELDCGLEVDALVRKGRDDKGRETYYVQAPRGRAGPLVSGFPSTREALFRYDAIALANVGADLLGPPEIELVRDFVAERGGGLLMLGSRTLSPAGLSATPLEELMPVAATDRVGRSAPAAVSSLAVGGVRPDAGRLAPSGHAARHDAGRSTRFCRRPSRRSARRPRSARAVPGPASSP